MNNKFEAARPLLVGEALDKRPPFPGSTDAQTNECGSNESTEKQLPLKPKEAKCSNPHCTFPHNDSPWNKY